MNDTKFFSKKYVEKIKISKYQFDIISRIFVKEL